MSDIYTIKIKMMNQNKPKNDIQLNNIKNK